MAHFPDHSDPENSDRTLVLGRTGGGKTVGGMWMLSTANFDEIPWVITDYKRDKMVRQLLEQKLAVLIPNGKAPKKPGIYVVQPSRRDPPELMDDFLLQVLENEDTGLFFDEGFMIPQKGRYKSMDAIMTQGRAMNIPTITLFQRPVWMSQFVTSQADYWMVYFLLKAKDRDVVSGYVGEAVLPNGRIITVNDRLPEHWFLWYDVKADEATVMKPVPAPNQIMATFRERVIPNKRKGLFF